MTRSAERRVIARCVVAAVALALGAAPLRAQASTGTVRDSASGRPLPGAVIMLLDSAGTTLARTTSDASGRYRLPNAAAAQRVRVIRLGFRPQMRALPAGGGALDVAMVAIPVLLEQVRVTAAASCPSRSDRAAAHALLDQVRAGLLATVVASAERPARMTRLMFERRLNGRGEGLGSQTVRSEVASTTRPFVAARRGSDFVRDGFLDATSNTFYAPDAETLIDEGFSAGYCFHLATPDRARPNDVGLAFGPAQQRDGRIAVDGTLWVDTTARALRNLEFRYVGLPSAVAPMRPGGRISFLALPNGVTIVDRWSLQLVSGTVSSASAALNRGRRVDVAGTRLDLTLIGGEVATATWPDGFTWRAPLGTLRLHLNTRDGRPAVGTTVRLDSTSYMATTDSSGTLTIDGLLPGPYAASIVEPLLARIDVALPTAVRFEAERDSVIEKRLTIETAQTFVERMCTDRGVTGTAWLLGRVVDVAGRPVNGARWAISNEHGQALVDRGRTGRDGLFHWCGLTLGATVIVDARDGDRRAQANPVLGERVTTLRLTLLDR